MSTCWRKRFTELTTQHDEYFSPVSSSEQSIFYRRLSSLGSWMGWSRFQQGHPGRVYQIKWGKISTIENELFMSKLKTRGHYSFSADLDEHKFNNSRALKYLLGIIWTSWGYNGSDDWWIYGSFWNWMNILASIIVNKLPKAWLIPHRSMVQFLWHELFGVYHTCHCKITVTGLQNLTNVSISLKSRS